MLLAISLKAALGTFPLGKGLLARVSDQILWAMASIVGHKIGAPGSPQAIASVWGMVAPKLEPLFGSPQGQALLGAAKEAAQTAGSKQIDQLGKALQGLGLQLEQIATAKDLGQLRALLINTWPPAWGLSDAMRIPEPPAIKSPRDQSANYGPPGDYPPPSKVGSSEQFGPPVDALPGYTPYDPGIGTGGIPSQKWQAYEPPGGWQKPEEVRDKIPKSTAEGLPITPDYEAGKKDALAGIPSREKSLDTGALGDGIRRESYRLGYQAGLGESRDPRVARPALQGQDPRDLRKQLLILTSDLRARQTHWILDSNAKVIQQSLESAEAALRQGDQEKTRQSQARAYAIGIVAARRSLEYLGRNPGDSILDTASEEAGRVADKAKDLIDGAQTTILVAAAAAGAVAVLGIVIWARSGSRRRR